jgi:hypothetical protein
MLKSGSHLEFRNLAHPANIVFAVSLILMRLASYRLTSTACKTKKGAMPMKKRVKKFNKDMLAVGLESIWAFSISYIAGMVLS